MHVTPEPLLVDSEESHGPSEYGSRPQHVSPLHSFFAPSSGDPVVEQPMATESSPAWGEASMPSFETPSSDASERIPTGPPPNRESLAGIPFLMPPPDFSAQTSESAAADRDTVDEVVRKVLARLEPQIHDSALARRVKTAGRKPPPKRTRQKGKMTILDQDRHPEAASRPRDLSITHSLDA